MTAKEAYNKIAEKYINFEIIRCFEYESLYVFQIVPKNLDKSESPDNLLDSTRSINKKTGQISAFNPLSISIEEYNNGKEIFNFK